METGKPIVVLESDASEFPERRERPELPTELTLSRAVRRWQDEAPRLHRFNTRPMPTTPQGDNLGVAVVMRRPVRVHA